MNLSKQIIHKQVEHIVKENYFDKAQFYIDDFAHESPMIREIYEFIRLLQALKTSK